MFIRSIKNQINQFLLNSYIIKKNFLNQQDILAQNYLAPLSTFYLPWSDRAIRPSGMVKILNDILINNHSEVVECGSGISTFYIASLLKHIGGHIYSIDHDEKWLDFIMTNLRREGLDEIVTTIHAPLKPTELAIDNNYWYDTDIVTTEVLRNQEKTRTSPLRT